MNNKDFKSYYIYKEIHEVHILFILCDYHVIIAAMRNVYLQLGSNNVLPYQYNHEVT